MMFFSAENVNIPRVYVLPVFQIDQSTKNVPTTLYHLKNLMYKNKVRVVPSMNYCPKGCPDMPNLDGWPKSPDSSDSNNDDDNEFFHVAKSYHPFHQWEPHYITSRNMPLFDERLHYEDLYAIRPQVCFLVII